MKLEVLLSTMNLNKKDLDKMNITSKCTVINQTNKAGHIKYKNFDIYNYIEKGVSNSRNRGLEKAQNDIILFCDDDVIYNKDYEKQVLSEFKNNPKADAIIFNFCRPNRSNRVNKKRKKLHIYNSLNYATYNIAVRRKSIKNIKFNAMFGPGAKFCNGSDTLFIRDMYKNGLKVYSSIYNIGIALNKKSTWFNGYDDSYYYNKGALFTAINPKIRHILMLQYLIRHKEARKKMSFKECYRNMKRGSIDYLNTK